MIDLPLERLADAVAALRSEVWNHPNHERRALPRIRIWAPRAIDLLPAAPEPLEVWLVDLACGGVGFLSPRALEVGQMFRITLPVMDASPMRLACRVLHCRPAPNGSFTVGARFIEELAEPSPAGTAFEPSPAEIATEALRRAS